MEAAADWRARTGAIPAGSDGRTQPHPACHGGPGRRASPQHV